MSKSITINVGATWSGTLVSPVNGDRNNETFWDTVIPVIGDRLGFLHNDKASLGSANTWTTNQTWTADNEFNLSAGSLYIHGGGLSVVQNDAGLVQNGDAAFAGTAQVTGLLSILGVLAASQETVADASVALTDVLSHRVPTLTANRTYTLPTGVTGQLAVLVRPRSADAFTVTLQRPDAATIGVIPVSAAGWMLTQNTVGGWKALAWSSNVTSILATV